MSCTAAEEVLVAGPAWTGGAAEEEVEGIVERLLLKFGLTYLQVPLYFC
jgi:hypothetical protein